MKSSVSALYYEITFEKTAALLTLLVISVIEWSIQKVYKNYFIWILNFCKSITNLKEINIKNKITPMWYPCLRDKAKYCIQCKFQLYQREQSTHPKNKSTANTKCTKNKTLSTLIFTFLHQNFKCFSVLVVSLI